MYLIQLPQCLRPPLLRVFESNVENWFQHGKTDDILRSVFDVSATSADSDVFEVSSFRAAPGVPEARVAVGQYQTKKRSKTDKINVVRIYDSELRQVGIQVRRTPGATGLRWLDRRHFDLCGAKSTFRELISLLCERIRSGDDRIRTVKKNQVYFQLQKFCELKDSEIDQAARKRCSDACGLP